MNGKEVGGRKDLSSERTSLIKHILSRIMHDMMDAVGPIRRELQ